jgi:acyl-coenzyme A synthetase/AMP-(fatty) acid ligase
VVDEESGQQVPTGAVGLLEVRGPQLARRRGCCERTTWRAIDDDGFIWIEGRADDVIIEAASRWRPVP